MTFGNAFTPSRPKVITTKVIHRDAEGNIIKVVEYEGEVGPVGATTETTTTVRAAS